MLHDTSTPRFTDSFVTKGNQRRLLPRLPSILHTIFDHEVAIIYRNLLVVSQQMYIVTHTVDKRQAQKSCYGPLSSVCSYPFLVP